jgi:diguanylate cyclase (GGDEF)-like protein
MPQKMWKHRCPKGGGGLSWTGSPVCRTCGEPGDYDGWHPGMYEAMARYQSKYGMKPIGPHRKMADELLGALNEKCGPCDGRGLRDTAHGSSWQVCAACRGFGSFFTRPGYEIQALRRRVLAAYPDAAADPVPNFFTGAPALSLADQKMVDLSGPRVEETCPAALCQMCGERRQLVKRDTEAATCACFCTRSPDEPVLDLLIPDGAWQQDVLALLPPPEDTAHLDRVWRLTADSSPLEKLTLWHPTDAGDLDLRRFLLDFGHRIRGVETPHLAILKELAFKDDATGLYNRRFFSVRLEEEIARHRQSGHPVSVVLLHLDGLARINDELGHVARDETLRAMAEILLKQTRAINVVSRHDGGLFAVVMVETSGAGAQLYLDRIRHVLSSATFDHGHPITARFSVASLPEDGAKTGQDLFRYADERLRAARPDRRWWRARRVSESG